MTYEELIENKIEHVALCNGPDRTTVYKVSVTHPTLLKEYLVGYKFDYTTPEGCVVYQQQK